MNSRDDDGQEECVVCCDRKEYYVLMCCSHALCADCEKRWVRKRLHCPFCRQSFSSVREAAQTEWQLSVSAIPTEHILKDVKCLEQKIQEFWKTVIPPPPSTSETNKQSLDLESFLAQNYVRRRQRTIQTGDGEGGFVVVVV